MKLNEIAPGSISSPEQLKQVIKVMQDGLKSGKGNTSDHVRQLVFACYALVRNNALDYGVSVGQVNDIFLELGKTAKVAGKKKIRVK